MKRVNRLDAFFPLAFMFATAVIVGFSSDAMSQTESAQKQAGQEQADEKEAELKVGDKAPEFEVTGIDGEKFKLSEKIGDKGKMLFCYSVVPIGDRFVCVNWSS